MKSPDLLNSPRRDLFGRRVIPYRDADRKIESLVQTVIYSTQFAASRILLPRAKRDTPQSRDDFCADFASTSITSQIYGISLSTEYCDRLARRGRAAGRPADHASLYACLDYRDLFHDFIRCAALMAARSQKNRARAIVDGSNYSNVRRQTMTYEN